MRKIFYTGTICTKHAAFMKKLLDEIHSQRIAVGIFFQKSFFARSTSETFVLVCPPV